MSKRKIVIEPDPILRRKSEKLEKVDNELRNLMDDMLETMYAAPGIGLAAVQIGILKRLIVIDTSRDNEKKTPLFGFHFASNLFDPFLSLKKDVPLLFSGDK